MGEQNAYPKRISRVCDSIFSEGKAEVRMPSAAWEL
jgi:hypothetical protein